MVGFYGALFLRSSRGSRARVGGNGCGGRATGSLSVGIGSAAACERLSGARASWGCPVSASIGLTLFASTCGSPAATARERLAGLDAYFAERSTGGSPRTCADRPLGGFYIVPGRADPGALGRSRHRSRIIAANNILNALFIVVSAGIAIGLLKAGLSIPELFLVTALMNAVVALYIYGLVPEFLMRFLAWLLVHTFYRVDKQGLEQIPDQGRAS